MADGTKIEWTDATANAVNGCSVLSPGCTNCYAMKLAGTRLRKHPSRAGLTQQTKAGPVWTGEVRLNEKALLEPLRWRGPRKIFWNAHGDLFHPNVPDEWIDRQFAIMALTPHHIHQVLTKRPERMREYLNGSWQPRLIQWLRKWQKRPAGHGVLLETTNGVLPNVWLGTSVEDQARANERIPDLLATPAAVRFLSCEPLLGPLDLTRVQRFPDTPREFINAIGGRMWTDQSGLPNPDPSWAYPGRPFSDGDRGLDWIIVGGESGPNARPMHPDWARSLRDQCAAAGVPFFFKQWGEYHPADQAKSQDQTRAMGDMGTALRSGAAYEFDDQWTWKIGKKAAGRLLDGVEHNGVPA